MINTKAILIAVSLFIGFSILAISLFYFTQNSYDSYHASLNQASYPSSRDPMPVNISVINNTGKLPMIYGAGAWFADAYTSSYIVEKFFKENKTGTNQLSYLWDLRRSKDFEDYKRITRERFAPGTSSYLFAKNTANSGGTLIWGPWTCALPPWLSEREGDTRPLADDATPTMESCAKPKCYGYECALKNGKKIVGWAGVIDWTLKFFKNELGINNLGYFHGHEQNRDWTAKEEDFYKLYDVSARAAKKVDKNIIVGGVGSWGVDAPKIKCEEYNFSYAVEECQKDGGWAMNDKPMTENFIEHVAKHNLPLDFVNYHSFGAPPDKFLEHAKIIRDWLEKYGKRYHRDFSSVKIYPGDWTLWSNDYPADYMDTEEPAAYLISSIIKMDKAGIEMQSHDFDIRGWNKKLDKMWSGGLQFVGDWAIFTKGDIIKPTYNAFRILSIFSGRGEDSTPNKLRVSVPNDDYISVAASQSQDRRTNRILLSYFIPSRKKAMMRDYLMSKYKSCMQRRYRYSEDELKRINKEIENSFKLNPPPSNGNIDKKYLEQVVKKSSLNLQEKKGVGLCLMAAAEKLREMRQAKPRSVRLKITGVGAGRHKLVKYLIDKDHSNSCSYNKKTEATNSDAICGINGKIDQRIVSARKEAVEGGKEMAIVFLHLKGYSNRDFDLIANIIKQCRRERKCIREVVSQPKFYSTLDRCKKRKPNCNSSTVPNELHKAYSIFEEGRNKIFYYDSPNSVDKINSQTIGIVLEVVEAKLIAIPQNRTYTETITLNPNSVMLIELTK